MFSRKNILFASLFLIVVSVCILAFQILGGHAAHKSWPEALREELGPPEYETTDFSKGIYADKARVQLGDHILEIPKVYIQTNLNGREKVDGLNLLYVLPDFTAKADFKNRSARVIPPKFSGVLQ